MWLPLASGVLVLVLSLGVAVLTVNSRNAGNEVAQIQKTAQASDHLPALSLSPDKMTYDFSPGRTYSVGVILESVGKEIDGVDVAIRFDPKKVRVTSTSVTPTALFERYPSNLVCNRVGDSNGKCTAAGVIKFSGLSFNPQKISGVIGTFSFEPLTKGEANFTFDFTPGATTDSNIAVHCGGEESEPCAGVDALGAVLNANYVFK